jgi:hypothetical protein
MPPPLTYPFPFLHHPLLLRVSSATYSPISSAQGLTADGSAACSVSLLGPRETLEAAAAADEESRNRTGAFDRN